VPESGILMDVLRLTWDLLHANTCSESTHIHPDETKLHY